MLVLGDVSESWVTAFAVVLGLVLGSFLNVVIHRLPRGENIAFPASRCTACGAPIAGYDNIPLLSWLVLRGRARCCKVPISVRYPVVEALGGFLAWAVANHVLEGQSGTTPLWRVGVLFLAFMLLGLGLVAITFIDLEFMIVPSEITYFATLVGIATAPLREMTLVDSALGAVAGFLLVWLPFEQLYKLLRGHPGMGRGDAHLLMLAGAWFGWPGAVFALMAGSIQGTLITVAILLAHGRIEEPKAIQQEREHLRLAIARAEGEEKQQLQSEYDQDFVLAEPQTGLGKARLAFGPFLALATLEFLFFGPWLMQEYLWFLG